MRFGRILVLLVIALSAGCVTARPVALLDGTHGWAIRCPHAAPNLEACMDEASMICSGRYQMLTNAGSEDGTLLAMADDGAVFVQGMRRTLVVSCQHDEPTEVE